jgi:hypothetical protein
MNFTPLPHQPQMLEFLARTPRAALFCEPGLGKTAVVLKTLADRIADGESKGVLILSPLRVKRITWPDQIEKWDHSKWLRYADLSTPEGVAAWEDGSCDIYLGHFDVLASREMRGKVYPGLVEKFLKRKNVPVDTLVVDESSILKDPSGKRANALRSVIKHFGFRILMTGTPAPNGYLDLFNQFRLLDDGERLGKSFFEFRRTFFESDYMGFKWTIKEGAKDKIDRKVSDICLALQGQDWLNLPPTTVEIEEVTLPAPARKAYQKLEKELLLQMAQGDIVALSAATLAGKLLQVTGGTVFGEERVVHQIHDVKIAAFQKIRKRMGEHPILVLTAYTHEMARLIAAVPGAVKFDEKLLPEWQAGRIHTMVANPGQLSHGIDGLQKSCRTVCWMTPTYSSEKDIQTNARIVRTGQTGETKVIRIIAKDTIDEAVLEALRTKGDEQTGLMQSLKGLQRMRR